MRGRTEADLVGAIYDAALGQATWDEIGARIASLLKGETLNLFLLDEVDQFVELITTYNMSRDYLQTYADHFARHDIWTTAMFRRKLFNRPYLGSELVPDDTFKRSLIYNEYLRPGSGSFHLVGFTRQFRDGGQFAISAHRPIDGKPFAEQHKQLLARLVPHLARAIEVRYRIGVSGMNDASRDLLDRLLHGALQLTASGKVLHGNAEAERILSSNDGLFRDATGLHAATRNDDNRLQQAISDAARIASGSAASAAPVGYVRIGRPSGRQAYTCIVMPHRRDRVVLTTKHPAVLIFLTDPEKGAIVDARVLQDLYGFTPAEARIAAGLAMGASLPEVAARLDITHHTARALLARANGKTETNSQLALVRKILTALPKVAP